MFLDVLIISFAWTVIVVTLLHIRGWFPFKVNKVRMNASCNVVALSIYSSFIYRSI